MLVIKAFVNDKQIDELHIQNMGEKSPGHWQYVLKKPNVGFARVYHNRKDGWRKLARRMLQLIEDDVEF